MRPTYLLLCFLLVCMGGCITINKGLTLQPTPERGGIGFPQISPDGSVTCYSVHTLFDQCIRRL